MKKRLTKLSLCFCTAFSLMVVPYNTHAAETGYVTVNDGTEKYATIDEAVAAAEAVGGTVTYNIYGEVESKGTNIKYTPDLALNGEATSVYVNGKTDDAQITLTGVYYQRFAAEDAELEINDITLKDMRPVDGEGVDPWEFTYIVFECKEVVAQNVTFLEGVMTSTDATFNNCNFLMDDQSSYYGDGTNYADDHYALWIHNYGNVEVNGCEFNDVAYGGIKSTFNMYNGGRNDADLTLTVDDTTFNNVGVGGDHAPIHLDGAVEVTVKETEFLNCGTNSAGDSINVKTQTTTITEENNVVANGTIAASLLKKYSEKAGITTTLENVKATNSIVVELYSGETKIATTTFKGDKNLLVANELTCQTYTVGTSSSWNTVWHSNVSEEFVPTKAVLYIDGAKMDTHKVLNDLGAEVYEDVNEETWSVFPGTTHVEGVLVNGKEASCTEEGYTGDLVCPICGELLQKGTTIEKEKHNHVLDESTVVEATHKDAGYTGDKVCACGDVVKGEVVEPLKHEFKLDESTVVKATCTKEGYTGDMVCSCGERIKGEVVPVKEHDHALIEVTVIEPTCTSTGYTGDKACECGDKILGEIIPALGHEDKNGDGKCDRCEENMPAETDRVDELADALKALHHAVYNGDLETLKEAVAAVEELDKKYEDAEEATEEEMKKLIELMGCETEEQLTEMILGDVLTAAFVLELEEPYLEFVDNPTEETAKLFVEAVYDEANLPYFEMFYKGITEEYAEAKDLLDKAETDKPVEKPEEEPKPEEKPEENEKPKDETNKGDSAVTSDTANISLFISLLLGSFIVLVGKKRFFKD